MTHANKHGGEGNDAVRAGLVPVTLSGLAGAAAVTLLNEGVRRVIPHAPRMEVIGERALSKTVRAAGAQPPTGAALYGWTMAADLASNTVYYALVAAGRPQATWTRGSLLGLAAGVGAVVLPGPMGLGKQPGARAPITPTLTVAWYFLGGLAAAATYAALTRDRRFIP